MGKYPDGIKLEELRLLCVLLCCLISTWQLWHFCVLHQDLGPKLLRCHFYRKLLSCIPSYLSRHIFQHHSRQRIGFLDQLVPTHWFYYLAEQELALPDHCIMC